MFFSDGGSKFQTLFTSGINNFAVMASNASLWMYNSDGDPGGEGFLVKIDHLNYTSGVKFSRAMRCQRMPENKEEEDKCDTLGVKVKIKITFCFIGVRNIFVSFCRQTQIY
jgi:hypothetical protein